MLGNCEYAYCGFSGATHGEGGEEWVLVVVMTGSRWKGGWLEYTGTQLLGLWK